ncbi:hypothetical protein E2C01_017100 [Portunus trituberculatus]|uniref:Uncharacterized protein n=1 Tax=Portunus trituberculatus TaxID=210409 RepID=A0A5B7DRF5_PORTR|nr:hypothetical protein [Portunus trituberculatus]
MIKKKRQTHRRPPHLHLAAHQHTPTQPSCIPWLYLSYTCMRVVVLTPAPPSQTLRSLTIVTRRHLQTCVSSGCGKAMLESLSETRAFGIRRTAFFLNIPASCHE